MWLFVRGLSTSCFFQCVLTTAQRHTLRKPSDELSSQHKLVEHTELLTLTARCEWYKDEVAFRQERRDSFMQDLSLRGKFASHMYATQGVMSIFPISRFFE